jgi:succinate dehydrogenase/fumarate reductase flavoprotein subunit
MLSAEADVLVIGGGMAAAWAAIGAAREGAKVIMVDKGAVGTSGVTATAGPSHWWVSPAQREQAVAQRVAQALELGEAPWMHRILAQTWETLPTLARFYQFCVNDAGATVYNSVRGPEYMRALRQYAESLGVRILDHAPALELLLQRGAVAGARGERLQAREEWEIRAPSVILATGGCAFNGNLLGSRTNTGDGYLLAAETGVALSGMEFSSQFTIAPAFSPMTRAMSYVYATYYDASGRIVQPTGDLQRLRFIAEALREGPVYADFARMPQDIRDRLPTISPNVLPVFHRQGIDPFQDKFPVALVSEGTIRGVGGLTLESEDCETSTPGLFAAGDAASREMVTGAISGGGAVNSAWALSSGIWSGQAAARLARRLGRRGGAVERTGAAGLRPRQTARPLDTVALAATVRAQATDFSTTFFRDEASLNRALQVLDGQWDEIRNGLAGGLRAREAAALTATARWSLTAAQHRRESRGIHSREDFTTPAPHLARRQILRGLDRIESNFASVEELAA